MGSKVIRESHGNILCVASLPKSLYLMDEGKALEDIDVDDVLTIIKPLQ